MRPGKIVAEARRSGKQWFVAVMNGSDAASLDVPLEFLGRGRWKGVQLREDNDRPDAWKRNDCNATQKDTLQRSTRAARRFCRLVSSIRVTAHNANLRSRCTSGAALSEPFRSAHEFIDDGRREGPILSVILEVRRYGGIYLACGIAHRRASVA